MVGNLIIRACGQTMLQTPKSPHNFRSAGFCRNKKVLATTYFPTSYLAVSSAKEGLTSEFGMGSGVAPPQWSQGQIC